MKFLTTILIFLFASSLSAQSPKSEELKIEDEVIKGFNFEEDSLGYVMTTLENTFKVKIVFENVNLESCLLSGKIEGSLEMIFEIFEAVFNLNIKYIGNRYIVSGHCY